MICLHKDHVCEQLLFSGRISCWRSAKREYSAETRGGHVGGGTGRQRVLAFVPRRKNLSLIVG